MNRPPANMETSGSTWARKPSQYVMYMEIITYSPWAKLITSITPQIRQRPTATRA